MSNQYKNKKCVKCGIAIKDGLFCHACTPEVKVEKELNLTICTCNKVYLKKRWIPFTSIKELLNNQIPQILKNKFKIIEFEDFIFNPGIRRKIAISLDVEQKQILVYANIYVTLCNNCALKKSKYFESNIQIMNATDSVMEFIHNDARKTEEKGKYITDEKETKNGMEIFLTDQTYAKVLAHKIQKEFGGKLTLNEKLFSKNRQSSKDLYRLTILLILPKIKKYDIIIYKNTPYIVTNLSDRIILQNILTKTKTNISYDEEFILLEKQNTTVTKINPSIEVLDPEDFSSIDAINTTEKKLNIGEKVKIVKSNKNYIVN